MPKYQLQNIAICVPNLCIFKITLSRLPQWKYDRKVYTAIGKSKAIPSVYIIIQASLAVKLRVFIEGDFVVHLPTYIPT